MNETMRTRHTYYLTDSFTVNARTILLETAIAALKDIEFDAVAFRGISGALIAIPLANALNKELIVVRKSTENSHADYTVEGFCGNYKYIIVDDFMDRGFTLHAIFDEMIKFEPHATCVGIYLYKGSKADQIKGTYFFHKHETFIETLCIPFLNDKYN